VEETDAMIGQTFWKDSSGRGLEGLARSGREKLGAIRRNETTQDSQLQKATDRSFDPVVANKTMINVPLRTPEEQDAVTGVIFYSDSTGKVSAPLARQVLAREKAQNWKLKNKIGALNGADKIEIDNKEKVSVLPAEKSSSSAKEKLGETIPVDGQYNIKAEETQKTVSSLTEDLEARANTNATGTLQISQAELDKILSDQLEYTLVQPLKIRSADIDLRNADTPLYSRSLVNRQFDVPGYGAAKGGEINYIGVGMMMAHYGLPFAAVPVLTAGWNGYQMLKGEGSHKYNQTFKGSFWAGYGYKYYKEHRTRN